MTLTKEQAEQVREQILEQLKSLPKDKIGNLKEQVKKASPKELESFLQQMQGQGGECIFCKIVKGEIDTIKIFEDKDILAILDIMPASRGHIIVFPKKHIHFIQEVDNPLLNKIMNFVKVLSPALVDVLKAKGLSIYLPQGQLAGQNVDHFFINVIPRYEGDNVAIGWERKKADKKELDKVAKLVKKAATNTVVGQLEEEKKKLLKHQKIQEASEAEQIYKHVKKRRP
ncbi:MAG: HIT family protein [archaeon]|nr:MAG: HIT family protein [archaeon]